MEDSEISPYSSQEEDNNDNVSKEKRKPHPSGVSSHSPLWYRNRKITILYYRSCGMSIQDISERVSLKPSEVRRYLDEILENNGV